MQLILYVILLAFLFETMDSAAGMGFGTGLTPLLFACGYSPLQVVPVLLISEAITGLAGGFFHQEFDNVGYSWQQPFNQETKVMLTIAGIGCAAIVASIILAYLAIQFPPRAIKTYVAILVLAMGFISLLRLRQPAKRVFRPKMLALFGALAGFNKGIGAGGYGPVVMLGQLFSGIYEKTATAIVTQAEGIVSLVGVIAWFGVSTAGVSVNLLLLPSVFAGSFIAALVAPYMVRVLPNQFWKIVIPVYALGIGIFLVIKLYILP